jgi:competence protein ComFC
LLPNFKVVSFYEYRQIEPLLLTKHHAVGSEIYKILAKNSFSEFSKNFKSEAFAVPIDDRIDSGYSHTAILAHALKSRFIKAKYGVLEAKNRVTYSGKPLSFRLQNPREFRYKGPKGDIVLVDDIVTTGTTLKEAYRVCKAAGASPLFALTLAWVKE